MSHVGVERLGSGDREDYGAKENEPRAPMLEEESEAVPGIRRGEDLRGLYDFAQSKSTDRHEPDNHQGTEYAPHLRGAVLLEEEERR